MIENARAMGFEPPPDMLEDDLPLTVWPECWDAACLFLRVETQWRPMGNGVGGLDYGVALAFADRLYPLRDAMELMDELQVMETTARNLLNEHITSQTSKQVEQN